MRTFNNFNQDIPGLHAGEDTYSWLLNLTPSDLEAGSLGTLTNTEGTKLLTIAETPQEGTTYEIFKVGTQYYSINFTDTKLIIYTLEFDYDVDVATFVEVDYKTISTPITFIETVLNIDSNEVAMLYMNVTDLSEDSNLYTINLRDITPTILKVSDRIIPLAAPVVTSVEGELELGAYQFAYRYVQKHGVTSSWSALSESHLTLLDNTIGVVGYDNINNLEEYQVAPKSTYGFQIIIPPNTTSLPYTHIEVCWAHYYLDNTPASMEIIDVFEVGDSFTRIYTKVPKLLTTLSITDFLLPIPVDSFKTFNKFNNRMFKANLTEAKFEPDVSGVLPIVTIVTKQSVNTFNSEGKVLTGSADPVTSIIKGIQSNSIYRLGVVYSDLIGRESSVHVLGDYSTPNIEVTDIHHASGSLNYNVFSINFNTFPPGTVSYKIVYVERTFADRPLIGKAICEALPEQAGLVPVKIHNPEHLTNAIDFSKKQVYLENSANVTFNTTKINSESTLKSNLTPAGGTAPILLTSSGELVEHIPAENENLEINLSVASGSVKLTTYENAPSTTRQAGLSKALLGCVDVAGSVVARITKDGGSTQDFFENYGRLYVTDIEYPSDPFDGWYYMITNIPSHSIKLYDDSDTELASVSTVPGVLVTFQLGHAFNAQLIQEAATASLFTLDIKHFCTPYGGVNSLLQSTHTFKSFSEQKLVSSGNVIESRGDTFIDFMAIQLTMLERASTDFTTLGGTADYVIIPIESAFNIRATGDTLMETVNTNLPKASYLWPINNKKVIYTIGGAQKTEQLDMPDLYTGNSVFSQVNDITAYFIKQSIVDLSTTFPQKIIWSGIKFPGEFIDAWLNYKYNDIATLEDGYLEITKLVRFNQKLLAIQERAISALRINELSQVQDASLEQIAIGQGDIIGNNGGKPYTLLAEGVGCGTTVEIVESKAALYWYDKLNLQIYRYDGQSVPQAISLLSGLHDLFKHSLKKDTEITGISRSTTGEVFITIKNDVGDDEETGVKVKSNQTTLQKLFTVPTDFNVLPSTVNAEIGVNATLEGSNALYQDASNPTISYPNTSLDINSNFTYVVYCKSSYTGTNDQLNLLKTVADGNQNGITLQTRYHNIVRMYIAGGSTIFFNSIITNSEFIIVLRKTGNDIECFFNRVKSPVVKTYAPAMIQNYIESESLIKTNENYCTAFVKASISDVELEALFTLDDIRQLAINNVGNNSRFYGFAEGLGTETYDIITGDVATHSSDYILSTTKFLVNERYGSEKYSNGTIVPLSYQGTSLGKDLSPATSLGVFTQDGTKKGNTETLLNNSAVGPSLDPGGFYDNPVSYQAIIDTGLPQPHIEATAGANELSDLKIIGAGGLIVFGDDSTIVNRNLVYENTDFLKITDAGGGFLNVTNLAGAVKEEYFLYQLSDKLNSYTVVYNEFAHKFTHIISLIPQKWFNYKNTLLVSNSETKALWKYTKEYRNIDFDRVVPSVLRYKTKMPESSFKQLALISEFNKRFPIPESHWDSDLNKTFTSVGIGAYGRYTDIVPIVPKAEEYSVVDGQQILEDTGGTLVLPQSVRHDMNILEDCLNPISYNASKTEDIWRVPLPGIPQYLQKNTPLQDDQNPKRTFYQPMRASSGQISLIYEPESNSDVIKLITIL